MEVKKNPKKDLRKKSILFFQAGLILVLLFTWGALERKSFTREVIQQEIEEFVEDIEEEIPITKVVFRRPPPPPPPPPSMEIVEVVEDDEPEPETVFEETDVDEEEDIPEEVPDFSDVDEGEGEEEIGDVPFHVIEESAIFPGCEKERSPQARKDCFSKKLDKVIQRKFNTDIAEELGLSGVQRIYVTFKIDKTGNVTSIQAKAKHPRLQKEAIRVMNLLPKMTPGKQRKKPVAMTFTKPITFRVE